MRQFFMKYKVEGEKKALKWKTRLIGIWQWHLVRRRRRKEEIEERDKRRNREKKIEIKGRGERGGGGFEIHPKDNQTSKQTNKQTNEEGLWGYTIDSQYLKIWT